MERRSAFFFSPTSSMSSSGDLSLSLPKGTLFSPFSPMDTSLNSSGEAQRDRENLSCSTTTPRRRLSLNVDENAQSPLSLDMDAGYSGSYNSSSCSSLEASLNGGLESSQEIETSRPVLGMITPAVWNSSTGHIQRKTLLARRLKRRISPSITEEDKENPVFGEQQKYCSSPSPLKTTCQSPTLCRPSSLPTLPLSPLTQDVKQRNFIKAINSPLERMTLMSPVPLATTHSHRPSSTAESDGYFSEVFDNEDSQDATILSDTLSSLLNGPLANSPTTTTFINKPQLDGASSHGGIVCPTPIRPHFHCSDNSPAKALHKRGSLKRSSPGGASPQRKSKRPPLPVFGSSNSNSSPPKKSLKGISLLRSQSCSVVPQAEGTFFPVSPGNDDSERIGDFSKCYVLPLIKGSVADLKCITPETLAKLLRNEYINVVDTYTVIDCRYPYEYNGGHIRGAINIWEKKTLFDRYFSLPVHPCEEERTIFIFHCEFSSKRGPDMSRFMRETDRKENGMKFPKLYYPEVYLLEGGYKAFFEKFSSLCEPSGYRRMADEDHKEDLKHFKHRSKSWNGESRSRRRPSHLRPRRSTVFDHASAYESTCTPKS